MIEWTTDGTDVDLHVTDPNGEECFYGRRETAIGGTMSRDVTQGLGPEMFVLERAVPGAYAIRAHCFASDRNRLSARTRVLATIWEDYGRPGERMSRRAITLGAADESVDIASVVRR
jgi:uncharacterized protein YfaP (DUF2135 family)